MSSASSVGNGGQNTSSSCDVRVDVPLFCILLLDMATFAVLVELPMVLERNLTPSLLHSYVSSFL